MKSKRKFFIWSIALALIFGAFTLYCMLSLVNNINGLADTVKQTLLETYQGITNEEIAETLNLTANLFLWTSIVNFVVAIYNFVLIFLKEEIFYKLKVLTICIALFEVIFGFNLIVGFIMLWSLRQPVTMYQNNFNQSIDNNLSSEELREQLRMHNMTEKIEIIKQLKANGGITDEEYEKLLKEIISSGVNE